jgi:prepilin-type processing-associated H-X9-DG protein
MYLGDFDDVYPTASLFGDFHEAEWLRWKPLHNVSASPSDFTNLLTSGIVPYIARFSTNLFTCPADRRLPLYRNKPNSFSSDVRLYQWFYFSYTFSSPTFAAIPDPKMRMHGLASVPARNANHDRILIKNRASQIGDPTQKLMFADELMVYELPRGVHPTDPQSTTTTSAGWNWPLDKLTSRHNKRGVVAFADGHIEAILPSVAAQPKHYDPLY